MLIDNTKAIQNINEVKDNIIASFDRFVSEESPLLGSQSFSQSFLILI